jgi:alkylation response protein AidB-like acyl-CoA dehydrogenase
MLRILRLTSKVHGKQVAFEVTSDAVQLFGGMGLPKKCLVEKFFRDTRAGLIEDGANDTLALAATRSLIDNFV